MRGTRTIIAATLIGVAGYLLAASVSYAQDDAVVEPQAEGPEVLTRGPVHEAFAEPVRAEAVAGLIVPKAPPQSIEELPPEEKPAGDNVIWISGYWSWDDEREDFLWVSGIWRAVPPGRTWVPGYWNQVEGGYQWTAGFWTQQQEVAYLPEPPVSVEQGPTTPAPSENHFWIPGCWRYRAVRYVWQPGYWAVAQPEWIWVPAHYAWSPGGWVFIDGYWDYPIARRGILFAPVYFSTAIYARPRYYFSPGIVIDVGLLTVHLFSRPMYGHYYFGDYYADSYAAMGIYPWFAPHAGAHFHYDPLLTYYSWHHRHETDWLRHERERYTMLQKDVAARPPHTLKAQQELLLKDKLGGRKEKPLGVKLPQFVANEKTKTKFETLPQQKRDQLKDNAKVWQTLAAERGKLEKPTGGEIKPGRVLKLPPQLQATVTDKAGLPGTKLPGAKLPETKLPGTTKLPETKLPGTTKLPETKLPTTKLPVTKLPTTKLPVTKLPGDLGKARLPAGQDKAGVQIDKKGSLPTTKAGKLPSDIPGRVKLPDVVKGPDQGTIAKPLKLPDSSSRLKLPAGSGDADALRRSGRKSIESTPPPRTFQRPIPPPPPVVRSTPPSFTPPGPPPGGGGKSSGGGGKPSGGPDKSSRDKDKK